MEITISHIIDDVSSSVEMTGINQSTGVTYKFVSEITLKAMTSDPGIYSIDLQLDYVKSQFDKLLVEASQPRL